MGCFLLGKYLFPLMSYKFLPHAHKVLCNIYIIIFYYYFIIIYYYVTVIVINLVIIFIIIITITILFYLFRLIFIYFYIYLLICGHIQPERVSFLYVFQPWDVAS